MKKTVMLSWLLWLGLLPLAVGADDLTGPRLTWNAPGEGSCWQITAAAPELGLVVTAEDPSGVKQGIMWMKAGHHGLTADFSTWSRIWGHTFASGGTAPPVVRQTLGVRMAGRSEGEYTFIVEFADMARHNRSYLVRHIWVDFAAPTVAITAPGAGRTVCRDRSLAVEVDAADTGCGVNHVQLYLNAVTATTPVAVDASAPYRLTVPKELLGADPLRIIVQAIDRAGRSSQAEVTVHPTLICIARTTR